MPFVHTSEFIESLRRDCGETGALIAGHDWSQTSLGPIAGWPQSLRSALGILLRSPIPIVMLWNEDGVMLYNDAYSGFAGGRHPALLGSKVREGWPEVADFNDNVMKVGLAGGTLAYVDQELTLHRNGAPERVWMNLDYSPVPDESGNPAGVIAIVVETTQRVLAERQKESERARQQNMLQQMPGFAAILNGPEHVFSYVNDAYVEISGGRPLIGLTIRQAFSELESQGIYELLDRVYRTGEPFVARGLPIRFAGHASDSYLDFVYQPVRDSAGAVEGIFVGGYDVTEVRREEVRRLALIRLNDAIRELDDPDAIATAATEILALTLKVSRVGYGMIDSDEETITIRSDWNAPGVKSLAGVLRFRDYGSYIEDLKRGETVVFADAETDPRTRDTAAALKAISAQSVVNMPVTERGRFIGLLYLNHAEAREWPAEDLAFIREVAERTRTATGRARAVQALHELNESLEATVQARTGELMHAEEQLRQAQKMEAVGQLTGGIAHDFNNMLAVVMGSLDLLGRRVGGEDARAKRYVDAALDAAKRAANLTQRLLAFSRQQPLRPESVDANRLVNGMSDLLRGSIGSDIRLETVLAAGLWRIHCDPNQLESVILNLGVNARDAMSDGGRLTIETQNTHIDARYSASHPGVPSGQYVMIAMTDTGAGMPPDVVAKAFDPFFTTKAVGKGTGLGLSQVYGFVRQSGGHVKIYSEVGQGTTVKIYLPRSEDTAGTEDIDPFFGESSVAEAQRETILVVDDEPAVRQFSCDALSELGYRVIEADGGAMALRLLDQHPEVVLLFTDIVMPDMNGRMLADAARAARPDLKVLYTTGYTRNAVVHNGILDRGVELIGKPYTIDELAVRVRTILDS